MEVNTETPNCLRDDCSNGITNILVWCIIIFLCIFLIGVMTLVLFTKVKLGQKTWNPLQRRTNTGSRPRPSLTQTEPTICISPTNLPPPPKYDTIAPPSYEEVVGSYYPQYQSQIRPITQPITALAGKSNATTTAENTVNTNNENTPPTTVITVTSEDSRTPVTEAAS